MNIYSLENIQSNNIQTTALPTQTVGQSQQNFADNLKQAVESINQAQVESDKKTQALANGEIDDLHDVMITAQKASIMLQTGVQVQKKVVDAYNEVMRMQV
ncbi:flagellar hook-basal body complex protein FliE [Gracilibacillus caseinilyticus]|uniref:Flagellar hook-basal body complex protein FliE n=1 Tax=Gracilibacillus caseinilyticus TaxID=2932256 RepID=A0ABY4EUY7_9BACI|nr:flagellar hook-basal body complex protein FliE [Gracilibacillus caseinilyticus]UOQ47881.1 flagellar hook-basal body complex protein FliE [Gracilibacillus caseinilyticus]